MEIQLFFCMCMCVCVYLLKVLIWQIMYLSLLCFHVMLLTKKRVELQKMEEREVSSKGGKMIVYRSLFKVAAGWSLRSTYYTYTFQRKIGAVYLLRTTC